MLQRDFLRLPVGEHPFELSVEIFVLLIAPKIIDHQEATVIEVLAQRRYLRFMKHQIPRFNDVDEGIFEELRIAQFQNNRLRIHLERRQLLKPQTEIQFAISKVRRPPSPTAISRRIVLDPHEGKRVLDELAVEFPTLYTTASGRLPIAPKTPSRGLR